MMITNLYSPKDVELLRMLRKVPGKTWGLTSGCYDLIHPYHTHYLVRCKRYCDVLVVGVDSDSLVRETKGPNRPIHDELSRSSNLDNQECVSLVFVMNTLADFGKMSELITPDIIFKNQGYPHEQIVGREFAKQIITVPDVKLVTSTTATIEAIQQLTEQQKPA